MILQVKHSRIITCSLFLFAIVSVLFLFITFIQSSNEEFSSFQKSYKKTPFKQSNLILSKAISPSAITKVIFKGNIQSSYGIPIGGQQICLLESVLQSQCGEQYSTITTKEGIFKIEFPLDISRFSTAEEEFSLSLYINIADQLIQNYTYPIAPSFLQPGTIIFDFENKLIHSSSKVNSLVNGQVEEEKSFKPIEGAIVTIKYYYPMLIAILEVVTNEVGYFEFKTELDFFEIILAEVEISKQGYETYFASSDPKFLQNKGIALCDTYNYTFKESIKLHLKES